MTTCSRCDVEWSGTLTMHCSGCHRTFTGLTAFDKHRTGSHARGRYCLDPSEARGDDGESIFADAGRRYSCWTLAGEGAE
ncbi:FDXHR family putative zinc-binding protein [Mycolicibacterium phlei]|uniref:FDXHR family putative zinc-binding protein n=1 Tax=Mycolicibacterium phlei TaxID=1771 RepID=UPI003F499847